MNGSQPDAISHYLAWAKLRSNARFSLASSGVLDYPLAELPVRIHDLEIGGDGALRLSTAHGAAGREGGRIWRMPCLHVGYLDGKLRGAHRTRS